MYGAEVQDHIVDFHSFCVKCKYYDRDEDEFPCSECIEEPIMSGTDQPDYFEEK